MPASLSMAAGTTFACSFSSSGKNLSDFLLTPPPTMNSSGRYAGQMRGVRIYNYGKTDAEMCVAAGRVFQGMSCRAP